MAATPETFKARFTEFADIDDARIQMFLDDAAAIMGSPARWLKFYTVAQLYYAAHLLYISELTSTGDGGVQGPISKQEVDDVVIEQKVSEVSVSEGELGITMYGKRYLLYRKICFGGTVLGT